MPVSLLNTFVVFLLFLVYNAFIIFYFSIFIMESTLFFLYLLLIFTNKIVFDIFSTIMLFIKNSFFFVYLLLVFTNKIVFDLFSVIVFIVKNPFFFLYLLLIFVREFYEILRPITKGIYLSFNTFGFLSTYIILFILTLLNFSLFMCIYSTGIILFILLIIYVAITCQLGHFYVIVLVFYDI